VFGAPFEGMIVGVMSTTGEAIVWEKGVDEGGVSVKSTRNGENVWCVVYGQ
jgi:hypothetical protein